ncbi:MAG: FAD-binding oxidoreductase [Pyrinomonadaceae bacterium]
MQVKTAPDEIQDYLRDTSNMPGGYAERLMMPASVDEVQAVLREANAARIPVTISGARTGTVGGAIPFGGWIVSLEKLRKIKSVDRGSMTMVVEPGALLSEVKKAADAEGLLYPPDPTESSCQIGGTIATNASGARSFQYGSTRSYVQKLKIVLPDGDLLLLERDRCWADHTNGSFAIRTVSGREISGTVPTFRQPDTTKNASGYYSGDYVDLIDLFIGSEGTLGIVVEAKLLLTSKPPSAFDAIVFFDRHHDLINFVDEVRSEAKESKGRGPAVDPALLEYFDQKSLRFISEKFPQAPTDVAGAVYFEQEARWRSEDELLTEWQRLLEKHNADLERSWFATTDADKEKMRAFRHALPLAANERYSRSGFKKVSTDMAVPVDRFRSLLKFYEDICGASGIDYVIFGHIGDCHLHLNLFPKTQDEATRARHIYGRCVAQAIMLGGVLSAEHGTGKLKRKYLAAMMGERYLNEMAAVKRAFDPNGILGRGNVFDESYL